RAALLRAGAGDQPRIRRGLAEPGHPLQRPGPVREGAEDLRKRAAAGPQRERGRSRRGRRAPGQLHPGKDRQPARRGRRRLSLRSPARRRRCRVPPGAGAFARLRRPAHEACLRPARQRRRRCSGRRAAARRARRACLRSRAPGAGPRLLRRGQAGRGDRAVGGSLAHGPRPPRRAALPEAGAGPGAGSGGRAMTDRAYALRFISGKYQGGEYPLPDARDLVIGRSSDLDMVLIEDMVSRKHARISLQDGEITIADLGSTNGTFVNGEKVKKAQLKEGDRVLIGTSILKLVTVQRGAQPLDARAAQEQLERTAAAQERKGRSAVQGRLEEVPLVDLLQLLSTSKKTGTIVISGYRGGRVQLHGGRVVAAVIDADPTLPPKKALYRMVGWTQGGFEFVPQEGEAPSVPNEIKESTEALVMEAMQQQDELGGGALPAPTSAIGIAMPLTARLRELTPDEIDLVQLVHNYGVVQGVPARAEGSDLEVAQKLASLLQRGYLRQF